ncbi:MAG: hypothetical protein DME26_20385 [Verrucomicrobia bacterium]|nr:MAG: hypothetical protein DME26_20385 [Verrucomicrobiota bacterium]
MNAVPLPQSDSAYFFPHQLRWLDDDSPLKIIEKSRQIEMMYVDAYDSVIKANSGKAADVYVFSRDLVTAGFRSDRGSSVVGSHPLGGTSYTSLYSHPREQMSVEIRHFPRGMNHLGRHSLRVRGFACLAAMIASLTAAFASSESTGFDFFERKIRPIFVERCYQCHSAQAEKLKGGLLLTPKMACSKAATPAPLSSPVIPKRVC